MKIPYFCCIGAELKRYAQDFDFMNQVYLYKVPTDDSIDEVLAEDYFKAISNSVLQDDIVYIYEASAETLHECRFDKQNGHITAVPLASDETLTGAVTSIIHDNLTPNKLLKSDENGKVAASDFSENDFVKKSGDTMTGPLKMRATSSFQCAIAPFWDGVGFYKLNDDDSVTLIASIDTPDGFLPWVTNTYNIGSSLKKWKNLYLAGKAYIPVINNGYDIAVPVTNSADTLALKSEVDLAANSGDQLYSTGVWYAKMYSGTTPPASAEIEGRNYADFSQTDSGDNPIIVIYTYTGGAWTQTATITPPADYNGYMTITSKIWDISEQAGQQGGTVLWSHNQRTFTPYPQIISFENAALTGTPTAPTLNASSPSDQIVNKQTLENALADHGTGRNVGDIFYTMRTDNELNGAVECNGATYNISDFSGSGSIGALLLAGKIPYISMAEYETITAGNNDGSCGYIGWDGGSADTFRVPCLNYVFLEATKSSEGKQASYRAAGLPNITGSISRVLGDRGGVSSSGAFADSTNDGGNNNNKSWNDGGLYLQRTTVKIDASDSSSIYGNSTTVQPKSVRYRAMIQLVVATTDQALETCTGVLADVAALKYDYVVDFQAPTAANNYTWYRKYKSGWVEQGGIQTGEGSYGRVAITLPIAMADNNYQVFANMRDLGNSWYTTNTGASSQSATTDVAGTATNVSATGFEIQKYSTHTWYVCGMSAS